MKSKLDISILKILSERSKKEFTISYDQLTAGKLSTTGHEYLLEQEPRIIATSQIFYH